MKSFFPVKDSRVARKEGYRSLTRPYHINHKDQSIRLQERDWWHRVCRDLRACDCCIVEYATGVEIWRHEDQLDIDPQTGLKVNGYLPKEP